VFDPGSKGAVFKVKQIYFAIGSRQKLQLVVSARFYQVAGVKEHYGAIASIENIAQ
jgi:hypothetical protein